MAAPSTCNEFLDAVRESDVVDAKRLEGFLEQFYAVSSMPEDPGELAADMIKAGLITPFQKERLFQGKRRGFVIADKYVLLDHLGAGGMGSVFLCEHKVMRRRVAIKVLPSNFAKDQEYLDRFHREARAVAALDHPNIVRAHDVDHEGKMHFLVMEYVEGSDLHHIVAKEGPLDIQRAADYISQAAAGLEHAHEAGLVHRDIKPSNLLVDRKGTVKILDMGLALFFQEKESLTKQYDASAVLGTADYLAPEQVVDSHAVDIRADIYSLGLTFFFLLTGKSPYGEGTLAQKLLWHQMRTAKSVREVRPDVPERLAAVIAKMIAKERAERYQTPGKVVAALAPWVQGTAEAGPEQEVSPASPEANVAAPTQMMGGAATLEGSEAAAETLPVSPERGTPSGPRSGKTSRLDKKPPSNPRTRVGKSGKLSGKQGKAKGSGKNLRSSTKLKRAKAKSPEFWTQQRLILVGSGAALFLIVCVGAIIWSMSRGPSTPKTPPGNQNPPDSQVARMVAPAASPQSSPNTGKAPVDMKQTGSNPATTPEAGTPPAIKSTSKEPVKVKGPEPAKGPAVASTNANPMAAPVVKTVPPPAPVVKKTESLADYFPKPGATLFYDVGTYANGPKVVVRQRWDFKDKGLIEISAVKVGVLQGVSLLKGGTVMWSQQPTQGKEKFYYRTNESRIETGVAAKRTGTTQWEPILPLSAAEGGTWKWQLPTGDFKKYTVVKFDQYAGFPAVVIEDSVPYPPDSEFVTTHTYVKGIGEVERTVNLEKKGSGAQLVSELKLVEQ